MRKLVSVAALAVGLLGVDALAEEAPPPEAAQPEAAPKEAVTPPPTPGNLVYVPKKDLAKNTITTNLLNLLIRTYSLEYERVVADRLSLFISPGYFTPTTNQTQGPDAVGNTATFSGTARGFGVNGGARYFLAGEAPRGLFIAPQVSFYTGTTRGLFTYAGPDAGPDIASSGTRRDFGAGVMGGYTVLVGNLFVVAGGLGLGITYSQTTEQLEGFDAVAQSKWDFTPLLHFNVGLAF